MSIFKRGSVYWFHFVLNGEHFQESTHQGNRDVARTMQSNRRSALAQQQQLRNARAEELGCKPEDLRSCPECGQLFNSHAGVASPDGQHLFCHDDCLGKWSKRQNPIPTFAAFAERFREEMKARHAAKPKTVSYYQNGINRLLQCEALNNARLDRIEEEMIANYVAERRKAKKRNGNQICVATVNRELEVLRRMLRLAKEWKVIPGTPKISRLPGERQRDRILDHAEEQSYLAAAKQPLRDVATVILDAGMRPEEVFRITWTNVHFQPAPKAKYGYIFNPFGKTKYARRHVPMTARVKAVLEMRYTEQKQPAEGWAFPGATKSGRVESLKSQHARALEDSGLSPFVLYTLRHTMLTRLGEAGADAFAIQKIAGHSSILISQRYVHPTPERIEGAITALEAYNSQKESELKRQQQEQELRQVQ